MFTLDTQIKRSGLRISHSKVFSSVWFGICRKMQGLPSSPIHRYLVLLSYLYGWQLRNARFKFYYHISDQKNDGAKKKIIRVKNRYQIIITMPIISWKLQFSPNTNRKLNIPVFKFSVVYFISHLNWAENSWN